jgi:hypothetical protein
MSLAFFILGNPKSGVAKGCGAKVLCLDLNLSSTAYLLPLLGQVLLISLNFCFYRYEIKHSTCKTTKTKCDHPEWQTHGSRHVAFCFWLSFPSFLWFHLCLIGCPWHCRCYGPPTLLCAETQSITNWVLAVGAGGLRSVLSWNCPGPKGAALPNVLPPPWGQSTSSDWWMREYKGP